MRVQPGSQGQQTVGIVTEATAGSGASPPSSTCSQPSSSGGLRLSGRQTAGSSWRAQPAAVATLHPAALLPASRGQAAPLPHYARLPAGGAAADGLHFVPAPPNSTTALSSNASSGTVDLCFLRLLHRQPLPEPRRPVAVAGAVGHKEGGGAAQLAAGPLHPPLCCAAIRGAAPPPPPGAENQLPVRQRHSEEH